MGTGEQAKTGRLRDLWRRLKSKVARPGVEQNVATEKGKGTLAPLGRFESLCEQLHQDALRIRRARPTPGAGAPPGNAATFDARRREATARLDEIEGNLEKLENQRIQHQANADAWRRGAERAVAAGGDDLAREALGRAKEHDALCSELLRELELGRRVTAELRAALLAVGADNPASR